jgi:hypothetical protein
MHSPSTSAADGVTGTFISFFALAASFLPDEAHLRVVCLIFSIVASIATIFKMTKK